MDVYKSTRGVDREEICFQVCFYVIYTIVHNMVLILHHKGNMWTPIEFSSRYHFFSGWTQKDSPTWHMQTPPWIKIENLMSHPEGHQAGTWPNGKCKAIAQGHAFQAKLLHFPFHEFKSGAFMLLLCCVLIGKKKSSFKPVLHLLPIFPMFFLLPPPFLLFFQKAFVK